MIKIFPVFPMLFASLS